MAMTMTMVVMVYNHDDRENKIEEMLLGRSQESCQLHTDRTHCIHMASWQIVIDALRKAYSRDAEASIPWS